MDWKLELDTPNFKQGCIRGGNIWEQEAKKVSRKHYKTGRMYQSIKSFVRSIKDGFEISIGTRGAFLKSNYHYPFVIHDGNNPPTKRKAHPFLSISYKNIESKMDAEILKGLTLK